MSERIYILDEIVVKPGLAQTYRDRYLSEYAPGARQRGMRLEAVRLTPPLELPEQSNTIHFLWSVANAGEWWNMRLGGRDRPFDPSGREKAGWWQEAQDMTVSRRRNVLVDFARPDECS